MEKWLGKPMRRPFRGSNAHYGKPAHLFKDSDRDGVMNVFDCKPYNKKKQDVISPFSQGNPLTEMFQRQETSRQQIAYRKQLEAEQRRLMELQQQQQKEQEAWLKGNSGGGDGGGMYYAEAVARAEKYAKDYPTGYNLGVQSWGKYAVPVSSLTPFQQKGFYEGQKAAEKAFYEQEKKETKVSAPASTPAKTSSPSVIKSIKSIGSIIGGIIKKK